MEVRVKKSSLMLAISIGIIIIYGFTIGLTEQLFPATKYSVPFLFVISLIIQYRYSPKHNNLSLPNLCILCMITVMCFFNNQNLANGSTDQLVYMTMIFLFFLICQKSDAWHKYAFGSLLFVGFFYALMTYVTYASPSFYYNVVSPIFESYGYSDSMRSLYQQGYIIGFAPHYSTNAMYLAVTLGVPVSIFLCSKKKAKNIVLAVAIIGAILLTGKRAHVIFSITAVIVCYYFLNSNKPITRWFKIFAGIVVGLCVFTVAAEFVPSLLNFVNRFIETAASGDIEKGRDVQRAYALLLWGKNPLYGIGWDGFKYNYLNYMGLFYNVHCVYVQLLCEVGIIGSIPFYTFFIVSFVRCVSSLRYFSVQRIDDIRARIALTYSVYIQTFFLIYCLTGNPLYDPPTLFTYIFGCTIGEFYHYQIFDKRRKGFE